ncbi:hypothetical protein Ancab_030133 [Ancistrocladus abbreviatus]
MKMPWFTFVSVSPKPAPLPEEELKRALMKEFDTNKDGRLSKEELAAFFKKHGSLIPGWRASRAMHRADGDGDGSIDEHEMKELINCVRKWGFTII